MVFYLHISAYMYTYFRLFGSALKLSFNCTINYTLLNTAAGHE